MRKFFLIVIFVMTVSSVVVIALLESWSAQHGPQPKEQSFVLLRGEDALVVATHLEEQGIVRNRFGFLYALARQKKLNSLVAGEYRLSGNLAAQDIVVRLSTGQVVSPDIQVTFPEGFTLQQMADRLTQVGLPGDDFLEQGLAPASAWRSEFSFLSLLPPGGSLEGFLFPDTYRFDRKADALDITRSMLATFERKAWPLFASRTSKDAYAALVLSSIVETEVRSDQDRALVADLFLRRLALDHPLQSDATVKYILGKNKVQHTFEETRTDSPYNTYVNKGLPPGPIANPGLSSIKAVLNPAKNSYFYFLSDPKTGETVFSVTFEEHVRNKAAHGL
ncbi:MAG: endolytic transglycosylase MltG [Candidatus Moranbacteria bacterium]|nr:endolytic transglycosylase MltG [Candidatus Moranbacteria bacterium]MBP6033954.1 endolytic transglycosylase MltG [Candidatus Moranbacteria bacterium]MBP7695587.1 endolytic transglycosylase MltG [Candidatus Moranbacteria bacterium]